MISLESSNRNCSIKKKYTKKVSKLERREKSEGGKRDEDVLYARVRRLKKNEKELGRTKNRSKERKE